MSDPHSSPANDPAPTLGYASSGPLTAPPTLLRIGGALGIGAAAVGLLIFLAACAGLNGAFALSFIPVLLGGAGFVLSIVGALKEKARIAEDTHVLAALFACCMGLIGGLLEMAVRHNWALFHS
jgi:hypothetical protein